MNLVGLIVALNLTGLAFGSDQDRVAYGVQPVAKKQKLEAAENLALFHYVDLRFERKIIVGKNTRS